MLVSWVRCRSRCKEWRCRFGGPVVKSCIDSNTFRRERFVGAHTTDLIWQVNYSEASKRGLTVMNSTIEWSFSLPCWHSLTAFDLVRVGCCYRGKRGHFSAGYLVDEFGQFDGFHSLTSYPFIELDNSQTRNRSHSYIFALLGSLWSRSQPK